MKGYKFLVPIFLMIAMLYSTYSLISTNIENKKMYTSYVEKAREYAKQGIVVDALNCYKEAINMIDSDNLRLEVADMLVKNNDMDECIRWMENGVDVYSESSKMYDKLLELYIDSKKYEDAYDLVEDIEHRGLVTNKTKKLYSSIKYKYELELDRYENAVSAGNGYFVVTENNKKGLLYNSKFVLFSKFDDIGNYSDELISVSMNGEKYYVDEEGNKRKVPPEKMNCEFLGDICQGFIVIKENGKYSYYNIEFEKQFGDYDYATNFNEGVAAVKEGNNWYFINKKGQKINKTPYKNIVINEKNIAFNMGRAFVQVNEKYEMIDKAGKIVTNEEYEGANLFEEKGGYAAVKSSGSWRFIDINGKLLNDDYFEGAKSFSLGMGAVMKNGKWGYIDENGKMVIENIFSDVKTFSDNGVTMVKDNEGWMTLSLFRYMN